MSLINDPELDLISITAPNSLHKDISIAALEANKHVYCEKPLAPTLEETQEIRNGNWEISSIPKDLLDRRVEITGPPTKKMVIRLCDNRS